MKSCPNCRQSFDDISYNFCLDDGTPLVFSDQHKIPDNFETDVETVIRARNFVVNTPPTVAFNSSLVIAEPVVAINIAQQYPTIRNDFELYEVTRGLWRLSRQRAERAKYAFAVFRGLIKEVYEIHYWEPAHVQSNKFWIERKKQQGEPIDPSINTGRFQFAGQIAPDFVRSKYVGKQLPVPHGQNPIRYFNC